MRYVSPNYQNKALQSADVITASELPVGVTAMGTNNPTLKATSATDGINKFLSTSSNISFFRKFQ